MQSDVTNHRSVVLFVNNAVTELHPRVYSVFKVVNNVRNLPLLSSKFVVSFYRRPQQYSQPYNHGDVRKCNAVATLGACLSTVWKYCWSGGFLCAAENREQRSCWQKRLRGAQWTTSCVSTFCEARSVHRRFVYKRTSFTSHNRTRYCTFDWAFTSVDISCKEGLEVTLVARNVFFTKNWL